MEKEYQLLRSTFEDAGFTDKQIAFLSKRWYIDVLARIHINSFRIELALGSYEDILLSAAASVEAEAAVGNAIYMLPSFYNHDCDPNAHILWIESVHAKLKALRDIEAGLWSSGKSATRDVCVRRMSRVPNQLQTEPDI